jgi:hypothetical protein
MSHKGCVTRDDDKIPTLCHHCVVTLTGSQLDPKVRGPAAWPPAECTEEFPMR